MSKSRLFNNESKPSYTVECDAFTQRGASTASYLQKNDSSGVEHYASYNEYACSVNVLNAVLNKNLKKVEEWMNKLGKTNDFNILVDFCSVPVNPFSDIQHLGGCLSRPILDVIKGYKSIDASFKNDCIKLLENKFTAEEKPTNSPG